MQVAGLVAAGVTLVSAFLPWVTVTTIFGSLSVSGFQNGDGDGVLTAIAAIVGGLCAWKGGKVLIATLLSGAACAVIGIYDWSNVAGIADDPEGMALAEAGIGLFGTVAGGIALVVSAAIGLQRRGEIPAGSPLVPPTL